MKERRSQHLAITSSWQTHCVVFIFKMSEDSVQEFQSWYCVWATARSGACVYLYLGMVKHYCAFFSFSNTLQYFLYKKVFTKCPVGLQTWPYYIQHNLYFKMCPMMADQQGFGVLRRSCKCPKIVLGCAWCHTHSQFK